MTKKPVGNAGKVYKKYTEEFRRDAVRMIESEGLTTAEVGRRLGVNANLLRKWRQTYGKKSETQAAQSDLEAEVRRLRDENRRLLMEREILKKAAAFFANEKN
ncbi:MAG: transposase [Planctomyces sp.]|jgi:transposase